MPKKYYPALYAALGAMAFSLGIGGVFSLAPMLQGVMVVLNIIIWLIGCGLIAMLAPKVGMDDEISTGKFAKRVFQRLMLTSFQLIAINFAISFTLTFAQVAVLGGLLFKHTDTNITYFVLSAVNYTVYMFAARRIMLRTGYTASGEREYNLPFTIISLIGAYAFIAGTSLFDSYQRPPLGSDMFIFANGHSLLTGLLAKFFPGLDGVTFVLWAIVISTLSIYLLCKFYQQGRAMFIADRHPDPDYDAALQNKIYSE